MTNCTAYVKITNVSCRCGAYTGCVQHEPSYNRWPAPSSASLGSSAACGVHELPTARTAILSTLLAGTLHKACMPVLLNCILAGKTVHLSMHTGINVVLLLARFQTVQECNCVVTCIADTCMSIMAFCWSLGSCPVPISAQLLHSAPFDCRPLHDS